jgi:hypothetical protein
LRTASANATETSTIDQASDHSAAHTASPRGEFELEVTEEPPTNDQLSTILDYLQTKGVKPSAVIQGASTKQDALKKLKEVGDQGFIRPVVCCFFISPVLFPSANEQYRSSIGATVGQRLERTSQRS